MIFSRRYIQTCLDSLREKIEPTQVFDLAKRLNTPGRDKLAAMWEAVILNALSTQGTIESEKALPSGKRPDIFFSNSQDIRFIADIRCISDDGIREENPIEMFCEEVHKLLRKLKLPSGGVNIQVEAKKVKTNRGAKVQLRLPKKGQIPDFVKTRISPEITSQIQQGKNEIKVEIESEEAHISLKIDPSKSHFNITGHPSFDAPSIIDRNPLYNALRDKAKKQLKGTDETTGIIICDGDSKSARDSLTPSICLNFLKSNSSIDFVLLISAIENSTSLSRPAQNISIKANLFTQPTLTSNIELANTLNSAIKTLPPPLHTPVNAATRSNQPGYGIGNLGGLSLKHKYLKISSRVIMEVLSGKMTVQEFNKAYGWNEFGHSNLNLKNPFEEHLAKGMLPSRISVTKSDEDDWLEIEFEGPDPAISPFK